MEPNFYDHKDSLYIGRTAEELFAKLAQAKKFKIRLASEEENKIEHWDLELEKIRKTKVDVKSLKRVNRSDRDFQDKLIWIEIHGVGKNNFGWLFGSQADVIKND